MSTKLNTIREIRRGRFVVEIAEHVEFTHPADTIATGDHEADREYVRKIESGEYPWYVLGVHVYVETPARPIRQGHHYVGRKLEIGSSYLGGVDTLDLHSVGLRDVVHEAIADARNTIETLTDRGDA